MYTVFMTGGWYIRFAKRFTLIGAVFFCAAAVRGMVPADFSRYEIILSRRPFGAGVVEAAGPVAAPVAPEPPPAFVNNLRMCAITERGGKVRVGFVDSNARPPRTYFLFVGDQESGFELLRADYEAENAVLRKDGHEVIIKMGEGGSLYTPGAIASAASSGAAAPAASLPRPVRKPPPPRTSLTREQYYEEQESGKRGEPVPPRRGLPQQTGVPAMDELPQDLREHAMRQYNLELIRSHGEKGVPLPIPLTPEEDAMLVEEGVLAP